MTKPRRVRIRQIVDTDGTEGAGLGDVEVCDLGVRRARWVRIVSAPASSPLRVSSLRSRTISSSTAAGTAWGLECGRRERGKNAASPSVLYRWTNCWTQ
jgi:hypothetical protein